MVSGKSNSQLKYNRKPSVSQYNEYKRGEDGMGIRGYQLPYLYARTIEEDKLGEPKEEMI